MRFLEKSTLIILPLALSAYITTLISLFPFQKDVIPQEKLLNTKFYPEDKIIKAYDDSLSSLCNHTSWQPGLYLNCTNIIHRPTRFENQGDNFGTFNIRSELVSCLRWAIDSGMGLIMPRVAYRSDYDLEFFPRWGNFSYLFDEQQFRKILNEQCPQLIIKDSYTEIDNIVYAPMPDGAFYYGPSLHRRRINHLLRAQNITPSINNPAVVWENKPIFGWLFSKDGTNIHNTLLDAVSFRDDIREISRKLRGFIQKPFLGLHLRVEPDQIWYTYEELRDWSYEYLLSDTPHLDIIFVSVGNLGFENRFIKDMKAKNITVLTKWIIASLDKTLYSQLLELDFDQIAVVDYEMLIEGEAFLGVAQSSFSYAVASERGKGNLNNCRCSISGTFGYAFPCCY
jgi:hypothetical protein